MRIPRAIHSWSVSAKRAIEIQRELSGRVVRRGSPARPRLFAGVDVAFSPDGCECVAGVVVWDGEARRVIEEGVTRSPLRFPYVPGLLSFREAPAIIAVLRQVRCEPDVFLFDGQGFAHPRRFGLACHVGVLLDRPSIGCAKSLLIGECNMPGRAAGCVAPLRHRRRRIGMAVRSRADSKPIYVSVGHRLSLQAAVRITLACCAGYRLPEPTRLADKLVARHRSAV